MPRSKTSKLWFFFPDIHIPEHDEAALAIALKAHEKFLEKAYLAAQKGNKLKDVCVF